MKHLPKRVEIENNYLLLQFVRDDSIPGEKFRNEEEPG